MLSDNFDAIIVGSGIGGLTVASLLAQYAHKKVLVLEKHFKLGGFTHTFRRDRWEWDVGLHYVGGMKAQGLMRVFMDYITGGIEWEKIQDPFEHFVYPGIRVDVPSDEGAYRQTLISLFPHESSNIVRYFREIHAVSRWSARWFASKQVPSWVALSILEDRWSVRSWAGSMEAKMRDFSILPGLKVR